MGFGDGSTLPVFDTPLGKVGAVICWENYLPLLRTTMYAKGIEIYCAPTADARDSWLASMRHIAVEGRCFVLSCNQFNRRRDFPADYDSAFGQDPDAVMTRGGSCIIDPFGDFLAGPNLESEAILIAEIDRAQIVRGKYDLDVVGHGRARTFFNFTLTSALSAPSPRGPKLMISRNKLLNIKVSASLLAALATGIRFRGRQDRAHQWLIRCLGEDSLDREL